MPIKFSIYYNVNLESIFSSHTLTFFNPSNKDIQQIFSSALTGIQVSYFKKY